MTQILHLLGAHGPETRYPLLKEFEVRQGITIDLNLYSGAGFLYPSVSIGNTLQSQTQLELRNHHK
jgi:hypothetical protein